MSSPKSRPRTGGLPASAHAHRWRIEAQGGPTSVGVCDCGAEREFRNSWDHEPGGWAATSIRGPKNGGPAAR